jgi:UrcA family protein
MKRIILIAAFAASGLAVSASAQGRQGTVVVSHADLDLGRQRDVARLDLRIAHAASEACGTVSQFDLEGTVAKPRCERGAIAAARQVRDDLVARAASRPRGELAAR